MGVGSGFAIAAALQCRDQTPEKRVVCIQGDSAFGFGGMEIETAFRYNLPIIFIIFNNNGIYGGLVPQIFGMRSLLRRLKISRDTMLKQHKILMKHLLMR